MNNTNEDKNLIKVVDNYDLAEPTPAIKFVDGKLMQAFKVKTYQKAQMIGHGIEWREIEGQ